MRCAKRLQADVLYRLQQAVISRTRNFTGRASIMDKFSGVTLEAGVKYRLSALGNPLFSITADVSLNVSPSDGAADYEIKHQGATGIAAPFSQTDLVGNYDATLTGAFAGGTVGVQGEFTFSTTPPDCETLDAALQEECRQAVQEMETGSITLQVSTSGTHLRRGGMPHYVHRRVFRRDGWRRQRPQVHIRRLRPGDRYLQRAAGSTAR